ncbi:MAG: AAA family ATPase, partial [Verrucomicrobiae bacterium]|nr:AAA family ATPase [Verrucomicrobiae bacterium]
KIDEIPQYLEDLKQDILDNLNLFLQDQPDDLNFEATQLKRSLHQRYEINVIVDNSELESAPILIELNPTYNNLFGKIERESIMGTLVTNFTLIRSGALHRANGGYLILPVEELLRSPFSWETLKRAMRNQHIEIEDPTEKLGFITTKSLRPEPIPINLQIILIGQPYIFHLLYHLDSEFKKLFKVKADFDPTMKVTEENLKELRDFIHSTCQDEKLLPVSNDALAKIFEYGHRLAGHQHKMTTQLDEIADILREANFYAQRDVHQSISAEFIQEAIREKKYRSNLIQEKIQEMIEEGIINIELEGRKTGQVNGLSVMDLGDIAFGRPSRITASASIGSGGIVDIEREAEMSGPIHTKGVLILSGFLFDKFGRDKQLNLSLSLVFEQNYGGVDGDSASSAELYAILSRLSGIPVRQGIAVTGSVDQQGRVQAVGGINEKIEGFFEVCKHRGLNGEQGVLIPVSNVVHLMLQEEVV